jgi:hypothetical protein
MSRASLLIATGLASVPASVRAQVTLAPTLGVSVGYHSSDQQHLLYALHGTVPLTRAWDLASWFRSSTAPRPQRRAGLVVRRRFTLGPNSKWYAGAGGSWTDEPLEIQPHGHWGIVALAGSEYAPSALSWEQARLRLFGEVQVFTFRYATAEWLVGLRLRFGH